MDKITTKMKNLKIAIFLILIANFHVFAHEADSLKINIDKRTKTVISSKTEGYSLLSDLRALFNSKNMTLTDSTWLSIREMVNSESQKDTLLKFMQDGKQIIIAFDMKNNSNITNNSSAADSLDWPDRRSHRDNWPNESVRIGRDGIHVKDGSDEVHISRRGVKVIEGGNEEVNIGFGDDNDSTNNANWKNKHDFGSLSGFNGFIGLNSYISGTNAPISDQYSLKPFGSRYFSIGWLRSTNITNGEKARLKLGIGVNFSWYNFMLENNNIWTKGPSAVELIPSPINLKKSKLTVSYLDVPLIPYLAFKKGKFIEHLGFGGYVGYRLGSHSKTKSTNGGNKNHEYNNFYLNDFRYGLTFQLGLNNFADLFVNYDLNPLFKTNKGPNLNAISFGIRL